MTIEQAAKRLGVEARAIQAVARVESSGNGFLPTGEPKILFERHVFYKRLKAVAIDPDKVSPFICSPTPGGYRGGIEEHKRLQIAVKVHRDAALESASWGEFQIMGYHWKSLKYPTLQAFINAMYASEEAHLDSFVRFIEANPVLVKALKAKDWKSFAEGYNGKAHKAYDTKMAVAYASLA